MMDRSPWTSALALIMVLQVSQVLSASPAYSGYNGNCYEVLTTKRYFDDSKQKCDDKGMKLVTVTNTEEWEVIQMLISSVAPPSGEGFWLGMKKATAASSSVYWLDGTSFTYDDHSFYQNWFPGEPGTSTTQRCIYSTSYFQWADIDCGSIYWAVCEEAASGLNECSSNPCPGNSDCVDGECGYICQCNEGFTGENCDVRIIPSFMSNTYSLNSTSLSLTPLGTTEGATIIECLTKCSAHPFCAGVKAIGGGSGSQRCHLYSKSDNVNVVMETDVYINDNRN